MKKILFLVGMTLSIQLYGQVVQTQFGQVEGLNNGNVVQFLGIPFAKPPVGNLRWKAPENPNNWTGILQTHNFAPSCPQKKYAQNDTTFTIEGNEDCLYLNVWTPQLNTSANKSVMVFIHGGGNQQGSAGEINGNTSMYFGKNMAERGDVVVVTIQYRLGPLGFLVHPGLELEHPQQVSGNYAVLDQILALQWVKNNIANFGGNPNNVMIFGESAGGVNVGNLMTTNLASGLFHKACIQSAAPVVNAYSDSKNKGISFVNQYISTGTDQQKINYMRSLSSDSLIFYEESPIQGGLVQMNWQPVLDGLVFTDYPILKFQSGNFNHVPLIIGSNADEMSLNVPTTVTPAMVTALIMSSIPAQHQSQALALYPPGTTNAQARDSYIGILSDAQFTANTRRTAECVSQNQSEAVYRYFFTYKHSLAQLAQFGSYHGMELFYVFNNWENTTLGSGVLFKASDDSVQQVMLQYWTNFAKNGNPNASGLVNWPEFQSAYDCYLEIKASPNGTQCGIRTAKSDFWDTVYGFQGCTSTATDISNEIIEVQMYPNPTTEFLQVSAEKNINHLEIFQLDGRKIIEQNPNRNSVNISLSDICEGMYILKIFVEDQIQTFTFVKN